MNPVVDGEKVEHMPVSRAKNDWGKIVCVMESG
jgi:hypothetical protein